MVLTLACLIWQSMRNREEIHHLEYTLALTLNTNRKSALSLPSGLYLTTIGKFVPGGDFATSSLVNSPFWQTKLWSILIVIGWKEMYEQKWRASETGNPRWSLNWTECEIVESELEAPLNSENQLKLKEGFPQNLGVVVKVANPRLLLRLLMLLDFNLLIFFLSYRGTCSKSYYVEEVAVTLRITVR